MARPLLGITLGTLCAGMASAQSTHLRYDASLGTLPTAQGFAVRDDGVSGTPRVVSGALEQGPTDMGTLQYWYGGADLDFDRGVVVEGMIRVGSSTYRLGDCASAIRFGYYLGAVDRLGRMAYIGISDSKLFVLTSADAAPTPTAVVHTLQMAGQWRQVKIIIRSTGVTLFADGNYVDEYPLGPAGQARGINRFLFGDGTSCGANTSKLRWAEVRPWTPCPADFNGDGFVDFADYDDFVICFEGGGCPAGRTADINGDGFVDFFDYDDFVVEFERGCPDGEGSPEDNGNGGVGNGNGGGIGA